MKFRFLIIFDTYDVVYNLSISLMYLIIYLAKTALETQIF